MELDIDLAALAERGLSRAGLAQTLAERLGITPNAAALRLSRLERSSEIGRELLAHLLALAEEYRLDYRSILKLRSGLVWDMFANGGDVYIGAAKFPAQGPFEGRTTVSEYDTSGAERLRERFGFRIVRAPTWDHGEAAARLAQQLIEDAHGNNVGVVSLGSPKISSVSEQLLSAALGKESSEPTEKSERTLPIRFVFHARDKEELNAAPKLLTAEFDYGSSNPHGRLIWNKKPYLYKPASDEARNHKRGTDFALVSVAAVPGNSGTRGADIVVAGISGVGTRGATQLLAEEVSVFPLPAQPPPYARCFLVEVEFSDRDRQHLARQPERARVRSYWTREAGTEGAFTTAKGIDRWVELAKASERRNPR
jgi:hypothetical protein